LQRGETYHIFNRGNNRGDLFFEERNYRYFLELYAKYVEPVADTYAYCLLANHFHLLVRIRPTSPGVPGLGSAEATPRVSAPSQQFGRLFNAYAKAINKAHGRTGSLFQNPFGRVRVTSDSQLVHLVTYIHRNPQKHGFVKDFRLWPYSSYTGLLSSKPTRLERDEVLAWFQGRVAFRAAHGREVEAARIAALVAEDDE
jgi:REP element-mobilizing transposase RayT